MTPYHNRLSPLTQRMAEDMLVRNLSPRTIDTYTYHVDRFTQHVGRPTEELGPEDVRRYQLHLINERKVGWSTCGLRPTLSVPLHASQGLAREDDPLWQATTPAAHRPQRRGDLTCETLRPVLA